MVQVAALAWVSFQSTLKYRYLALISFSSVHPEALRLGNPPIKMNASELKLRAAQMRDDADMQRARDAQAGKIDDAIQAVSEVAAQCWYRDQCRNVCATFFLWYRKPHEGEVISTPIVSIDQPNDEYMRDFQFSAAWTRQQAQGQIAKAMRTLPILAAL